MVSLISCLRWHIKNTCWAVCWPDLVVSNFSAFADLIYPSKSFYNPLPSSHPPIPTFLSHSYNWAEFWPRSQSWAPSVVINMCAAVRRSSVQWNILCITILAALSVHTLTLSHITVLFPCMYSVVALFPLWIFTILCTQLSSSQSCKALSEISPRRLGTSSSTNTESSAIASIPLKGKLQCDHVSVTFAYPRHKYKFLLITGMYKSGLGKIKLS